MGGATRFESGITLDFEYSKNRWTLHLKCRTLPPTGRCVWKIHGDCKKTWVLKTRIHWFRTCWSEVPGRLVLLYKKHSRRGRPGFAFSRFEIFQKSEIQNVWNQYGAKKVWRFKHATIIIIKITQELMGDGWTGWWGWDMTFEAFTSDVQHSKM